MSHSNFKTKQKLKRGLQRISYVSEAALSVAAGVFGWMNPGATLLGVAVATPLTGLAQDALNSWTPESYIEDEYFEVMEAALEHTKIQFLNKPSKLALLDELSVRVDELDMDLATVIQNTETFQTKYMTMIDTKEILLVFEDAFDQELVKHTKLSRYNSIKTGNNTLDLLKRVHVIVTADSKKLDQIFEYVRETSNDTAQIKADVQEIKTGMDYLRNIVQWLLNTLRFVAEIFLQSMVIFFSFTVATAFLDVQAENTIDIYMVVMVSEFLIHFLSVRVKGFRTTSAVIVTQTLFIATCSLLMIRLPVDEHPSILLHLTVCSFIGVCVKYCLLFFRASYNEK